MTSVAAKRYSTVQKHLEFFPKAYSSCKSIGNKHCFLVHAGGGVTQACQKLPRMSSALFAFVTGFQVGWRICACTTPISGFHTGFFEKGGGGGGGGGESSDT